MAKRVVHVVTNVDRYEDGRPTGLWLSELTHAWDHFAERGLDQRIISPVGGRSPLEPRALKWPLLDRSAKAWLRDPRQMARLERTQRPEDIDPLDCDVLFFTGGHGVMWDFPDSPGLQTLTRAVWERGGIVAAVCHGYCALLNTRLTTGRLLVMDRMLTGFSWAEEMLAGVAGRMPYNAEAEMTRRGAVYLKGLLPFGPYVVADGLLVTGQNPGSAKATARKVTALLDKAA
ncbi:MAG TPA: type 1 glutamine amidotransferase domain-containing protein [Brevundimonas sp.]|nr:type 1 glutamine amidotransferase domain-containing protein [Brevundimonas sp.]